MGDPRITHVRHSKPDVESYWCTLSRHTFFFFQKTEMGVPRVTLPWEFSKKLPGDLGETHLRPMGDPWVTRARPNEEPWSSTTTIPWATDW